MPAGQEKGANLARHIGTAHHGGNRERGRDGKEKHIGGTGAGFGRASYWPGEVACVILRFGHRTWFSAGSGVAMFVWKSIQTNTCGALRESGKRTGENGFVSVGFFMGRSPVCCPGQSGLRFQKHEK